MTLRSRIPTHQPGPEHLAPGHRAQGAITCIAVLAQRPCRCEWDWRHGGRPGANRVRLERDGAIAAVHSPQSATGPSGGG
nr:hypothetical protein [Kibdelosporangium sp. MJ126-NF4]